MVPNACRRARLATLRESVVGIVKSLFGSGLAGVGSVGTVALPNGAQKLRIYPGAGRHEPSERCQDRKSLEGRPHRFRAGISPGQLFAERGVVSLWLSMTPPQAQPKFQLVNTPDYRESYANSVQIRVNLWDFFLMFGTVNQTSPDNVLIHNFQGVYLSPQQAKALLNILTQNISQYEATFGEIKLEPHGQTGAIQ